MKLHFSKYQGTGNDFILMDNRAGEFDKKDVNRIAFLCHRKFGIGADGLLLLENKEGYDFDMVYFNSDGNPSTMCGNGGRCIVAYAKKLGVVKDKVRFNAVDGQHEAVIVSSNEQSREYFISLKMADVSNVQIAPDHYILDTGSPHYVKFVQGLYAMDVYGQARNIRYSEQYKEAGVNVNFAENMNGNIWVRTYERGVENETMSCGTGMTAVALCASLKGMLGNYNYCRIRTMGGDVSVRFQRDDTNRFRDIWLEGPAQHVFDGVL